MKCDDCGVSLTAYLVKGKKATYYKCNTPGCKVNRNTKILHDKLIGRFNQFSFDPKFKKPIEQIMVRVFQNAHETESINNGVIIRQINSISSRISNLVDNYMDGNISREVYEETMARYEKERADAQAKLQEQPNAISNIEE